MHTTGPWQDGIYHAKRDGGRTLAFITKPGRLVPIAVVDLGPDGYGREEGEANARLIAASPDMRNALAALLPAVDAEIEQRKTSGNDEYWQGLKALSDAGHAALAKSAGSPIAEALAQGQEIARLLSGADEVSNIVAAVSRQFRTFGGGRANPDNPVAMALKDRNPQFAAGVDVGEVVTCVLHESGCELLLSAAKAFVDACGGSPPDWLAKEYALAEDAIATVEGR